MSPVRKYRSATVGRRRRAALKQRTAPSDPDAMLVELGNKLDALSAELTSLQNDKPPNFSATRNKMLNDETTINPSAKRVEEILALLDPIERAIMAIPATTVVGLGVKARHAAHVLSHYWTDSTDMLDWDVRAVRLLIESTCSVAGVNLLSSRQ
jgi:hypothetical protein